MDLGKRAWVIVGGESQAGARAMQPAHARHLRDQCIEAGVPLFFKQWGVHNSDLVRIGKKKAGSMLDGREWKQFPNPRAA
jgi:protein gp37